MTSKRTLFFPEKCAGFGTRGGSKRAFQNPPQVRFRRVRFRRPVLLERFPRLCSVSESWGLCCVAPNSKNAPFVAMPGAPSSVLLLLGGSFFGKKGDPDILNSPQATRARTQRPDASCKKAFWGTLPLTHMEVEFTLCSQRKAVFRTMPSTSIERESECG